MRYTWLVEKYLEGELSGEALRKFELDILRKPEVAEEVERIRQLTSFSREQHKRLHNSLGLVEDFDDIENVINEQEIGKELEGLKVRKISSSRDAVREIEDKLTELQVEDILGRHNSNKILVKKVSVLLAGTAMAILIAVSSILLLGSGKPAYTELYSEYYYPRPADIPRSASIDSDDPSLKAMDFYNKMEYAKAYQLMNLIPENETSDDFLLYKGILAMEMREYRTAIEILNKLDENTILKHEGKWYKSLCYLALEDDKATRFSLEEIIRSNGYHKDNAISLIRKL